MKDIWIAPMVLNNIAMILSIGSSIWILFFIFWCISISLFFLDE